MPGFRLDRRVGGRARPPGGLEDPVDVLARWATRYLCQPHPQLGRPGPVCPYVGRALQLGALGAVVRPQTRVDVDEVVAVMRTAGQWFTSRRPLGERSGLPAPGDPHRALLVAFPSLVGADGHRVVEEAQRLLKTELVDHGLMVGEFHDGPPPVPGLWNPHFRPLLSPVPLLAIRPMVRNDLAFLRADPRHLAAYHRRFGRTA